MYQFIRKVHLFLALALLLFVLFYAVSGYVMLYPNRFAIGPQPPTTRSEAISYSGDKGSMDFVDYLKEKFDLPGRFNPPRMTKSHSWEYLGNGPAAFYDVTLAKDGNSVTIVTRQNKFSAMLNRFHHLSGFGGGRVYDAWAVIFDLVCAALLLFAVSGVYLWWKLTRRRTAGWIVVGISTAYAGATLAYCLLAP